MIPLPEAGALLVVDAAAGLADLTPGSGQASRDRLVDLGEIARVGNQWRVVDPLYADWLRRRFPI